MSALNVAVWGLGPHALKNILPALAAVPGVMLYGVCSRNAGAAGETADRFRCARWNTAEAMLADPAIDAVYVSTPIGLHASHGEAVLRARKHLWCEKPIVEDGAQAAFLTALSRERGVAMAEAFMFLYHPQFRDLRGFVASGRLGDVHTIACRFGIPPLDDPRFRSDPALGGGAFLDVGSYTVAALTALFPEGEPDVAFAEIATAAGSRVDTAGRALLRYDNGPDATLEWRIDCAYRNEIDLWGSLGSLSAERIFSKPAEYVPAFRFRDLRGAEHEERGTAANHFVMMFGAFRELAGDPAAAERERVSIARRAGVLDRIRAGARKGAV